MSDSEESARPLRGVRFQIGSLTLDSENMVLLRGSSAIKLGRRAVALLYRLVQSPGEIVSKEALYDSVWQGRIVEDSNLNVQVSQIRRVLHAEAGGFEWIETLSRRGYRFNGPVIRLDVSDDRATSSSAAPVAAATRAMPISNVPVGVPLHFAGREDDVVALASTLARQSHRPSIAVLWGLRGIGKTILAAAFARRHETAYGATWWVRADTTATLRADLAALAIRLGWAELKTSEAFAFNVALERLRDEGDGILLIYDNASDALALRAFLPKSGRSHIIITSNSPAWRAYAYPIELKVWPSSVGADFLIARTDRIGERGDAEALSQALDGLPLAHEQAAAYIESLEIPFADYLRRLSDTPVRLLDDVKHAPLDYHDGLTVGKAFDLAIAQAEATHPAARALLQCTALLPPQPIPVFLLREAGGAFEEPFASLIANDQLDLALATLRRLALINREMVPDERDPSISTDCVRLHRLVRTVTLFSTDDESMERLRGGLIAALAAAYPANVFFDPMSWQRARRLDVLAMALVGPDHPIPEAAEAAASVLLDRLGSFHHGALAAFGEAQTLFERANSLAERAFGMSDAFTAQTMNNLALLLRNRGDLAAARPLFERSLALREAVLGSDHPDVGGSLNNLALVLTELGDASAARPLMERSLAIRVAADGEHSRTAAQGMNNLANILLRLGELPEAKRLHEQALAIRETCLGPKHPDTANSLKNVARVLLQLGHAGEARRLAERALAIALEELGPMHPETATIQLTVARCALALGSPFEALPLAESALASFASTLVPGAAAILEASTLTADCFDALGLAERAAERRASVIAGP